MKAARLVHPVLIVALCTAITAGQMPAFAQAPETRGPKPTIDIPILQSTGVLAGEPEGVLPRGAILHVRINNLEELANDINDLVMSFLPEKAVPTSLQSVLDTPKPFLTFIGRQSIGAPLSAKTFAEATGINALKPISFTLYPGKKRPDFVFCVPMAQGQLLSGMVMNILAPRIFERTSIGAKICYRVVPTKQGMPKNIYIVCSPDAAYFSNSPQIALSLASVTADQKMDATTFISAMVAKYKKNDLTVVLDVAFAKELLAQLQQQYSTIRPQLVEHARENINRYIPPDMRQNLDFRLRLRFNIAGVDELLDYTECFVTATYEALATYLFAQIQAVEGLAFSIDFSGKYQSLYIVVGSKKVLPQNFTSSLPMDEIRKAIARLPGSKSVIRILGRRPSKRPSALMNRWLDLLQLKMKAKDISSPRINEFVHCLKNKKPSQPLESQVDWTVATRLSAATVPRPSDFNSTIDYLKAISLEAGAGSVSMAIMPAGQDKLLEKYFASEAKNLKNNIALDNKFSRKVLQKEPDFDKDVRCRAASLDGGVRKLVLEKAYLTRNGFFGYDQHELINRRILFYRKIGNELFVLRDSLDPDWLTAEGIGTATPVPKAVTALIDKTPADAGTMRIGRGLHMALGVIDILAGIEQALHKELDAYLIKAKQLLASSKDRAEVVQELTLAMPVALVSLNRDPVTGQLYGVFPGNFTYPRPKVMQAVANLFADFRTKVDNLGGGAVYTTVAAGYYEIKLVQGTEGVGYLVKSVINNAFEKYLSSEEGMKELQQILRAPRDASIRPSDILFTNPFWKMLMPLAARRLSPRIR